MTITEGRIEEKIRMGKTNDVHEACNGRYLNKNIKRV